MANLLDTTVLIDWTRGADAAAEVIDAEAAADAPTVSIISAMELIVGCRDAQEVQRVRKLLELCRILPVSPMISDRAYKLIVSFSKSHGLLIPDALIAATALVEGLTLFTDNVLHFSLIPDLRAEKPY